MDPPPPSASPAAPPVPRKRLGTKVVSSAALSAKTDGKRKRKLTAAGKALDEATAKKKKPSPRPTPTPPLVVPMPPPPPVVPTPPLVVPTLTPPPVVPTPPPRPVMPTPAPVVPTPSLPPPVTRSPHPPPPTATSAAGDDHAHQVSDKMPESVDEDDIASFMSQLDESHILGLDDIAMSMADDRERAPEVEEVEEPVETQAMRKTRSLNYKAQEDIALCDAWMNVSLDASIGTDQTKDKFWSRIEEYYSSHVSIRSNRTQGSLAHRWSVIQDQCNRWSGCVDQVNIAPPSGVPINEYGPIIQELYKQRNKKGGGKPFILHHCYKELQNNEKWARRNYETTPKRARISISVDGDDDLEEENPATPQSRPDGQKRAKERKKNGGVGAYKEELLAMIETKKALAAERKEEKMARWNELKSMEEERWRAKAAVEDRKLQAEERRIALEEERLAKERKAEDRAIMFMDPSTMDETARQYWQLTRGEILATTRFGPSGSGGDGGGGGGGDYGSA